MTIKNFTEHLSKYELKKGEDYYRRKKVTKLKEEDAEEWTAVVNGREAYDVEVSLEDDEITEVYCDCVAHTENDFCKHVIAVLFAIQEKEGILKTATSHTLESIINNLSVKELRYFLLEHARKNQEIKNDLVNYQEMIDNEDKNVNRYCALINQFIENAAAGKGAKAAEKINGLLNTISELQKKADKAYTEMKFLEAAEINLAIVKTLPAATGNMKATVGSIKTSIEKSFLFLLDLVSDAPDAGSDYVRLVLKHANQHVKDEAFPLAGHKTHWIDIIAWCSIGSEETVLHMISEIAALPVNQNSETNTKRLAALKKFVEEPESTTAPSATGATDKALDFKTQMETAIKAKKYEEAKQMAEKAMLQAKQEKDLAVYEEIKLTLMSALQRSSDVLGFRELARRFYEENMDARYYAMWKDTHIQSEWEKVSAELIAKLERNIFAYAAGKGDPTELAFVYVQEYGHGKSLLNLLKKAPRLAFINEYVEGFGKSFATPLLQLYKDVLLKYAIDNKGIQNHLDFLLGMEKMQALKGGKPAVQELVAEIKVQSPALYQLLPAGMKK